MCFCTYQTIKQLTQVKQFEVNMTKERRQFPHSHVFIVATSIIVANGCKLAVESSVEHTVTSFGLLMVSNRVINKFVYEEMTQLITKMFNYFQNQISEIQF